MNTLIFLMLLLILMMLCFIHSNVTKLGILVDRQLSLLTHQIFTQENKEKRTIENV